MSEDLIERARRNLQAAFAEPAETTGRDEWLSLDQAARYLRLSRTTLHRKMNAGELDFRTCKVGRSHRISRSDVEAYWEALMRKMDPLKNELVRHGEALGVYDDPDQ